jgi:hypothetical protein
MRIMTSCVGWWMLVLSCWQGARGLPLCRPLCKIRCPTRCVSRTSSYLHLSTPEHDTRVGEAWEAFPLAMVNGTNTTVIGLVQINVANATDQGDHLLCIDCGSCYEGDLVRTWRCFTNFSMGNDVRSQVWALEVRGPLTDSDWSEMRPSVSSFFSFCQVAQPSRRTIEQRGIRVINNASRFLFFSRWSMPTFRATIFCNPDNSWGHQPLRVCKNC